MLAETMQSHLSPAEAVKDPARALAEHPIDLVESKSTECAASSETHSAGILSERVFRVTLSPTGVVAGEEGGSASAARPASAASASPFASSNNNNSEKTTTRRRVRVRYAAASKAGADPAPPMAVPGTPGPDKPNQDAWLAHERAGGGEALLLGVFDGHGAAGAQVSGLLAARLAGLAAAAGLGRADAGGRAGGVPKKPAPPGGWPAAAGRSGSGGLGDERMGLGEQASASASGASASASATTTTATTTTTSAGGLFAGLLGRRAPARPVASSCSTADVSSDSNAYNNAPSSPLSSSTTTTTTSSALHVRRAVPPPLTSAGDALALDAALARAHAAVLAAAEIDATLSGSTAVTLALGPSGLAVAHVGDSRALLGRVFYEETELEGEEGEDDDDEEGGEKAEMMETEETDDSVSSEGGADPLQSASSGGDTKAGSGGSAGSGDDELLCCDDDDGGGDSREGNGTAGPDSNPNHPSNSEEAAADHQQHVAARLAAADRRRKQHEKLLQPQAHAGGGGGAAGGRRNSNASSTCAFDHPSLPSSQQQQNQDQKPTTTAKGNNKPRRKKKTIKKATLLPALALTSDHVPTRPDEASRIYAHRGRIGAYSDNGVPVGPLRVWLPSVDAPGLCMTRAVGDAVGALAGVSARAEVSARPLSRRDRYLVLVSDGVHEFSTNDEIMATVHAVAEKGGGPAEAAAALVATAKLQWIAEEWGASDDCTAVVAFLEDDDDDADDDDE